MRQQPGNSRGETRRVYGKAASDPVFVTTIYGSSYLPFLGAHLYTFSQCHPGTAELVLWQDLPAHEIDLLSSAFPHCRFFQIEEPIEGDPNQKIARRTLCWHTACQLYPDNPLCFIDSDALLVQPIGEFITSDFDVLFTWKDEPFPLNAGVLLVGNGQTGGAFLEEWAARTERIVTDPVALSRALAVSGAADQHALREIIGFVNYDGAFTRNVAGHDFVFKGVPCRLLNETNCVPITDDTHVIHYKAGWHPILLRGQGFTEHRPEEKCREMYEFWLETAAEANKVIARNVVFQATRDCVDRFRRVNDSYEERGILHSEMLAVCAVCDELGIEVIIESGRYRGQSTFILARYFERKGIRVISIELDRENAIKYLGPEVSPAVVDENMAFVEKRLAPYSHVRLLYGDAENIVPQLVRELAGKRLAILLDGPKGLEAIDLVRKLLGESDNVVAAFFHDAQKGFPQRAALEDVFSRVFFTDDQEYVERYSELDMGCRGPSWQPYWMPHYGQLESYGPTFAIVFPMAAEGSTKWSSEVRKPKGPVELVNAFFSLVVHEGLRSAFRQTLRWIYWNKGLHRVVSYDEFSH